MTNHRQPTHHLAYNKILKPVVEVTREEAAGAVADLRAQAADYLEEKRRLEQEEEEEQQQQQQQQEQEQEQEQIRQQQQQRQRKEQTARRGEEVGESPEDIAAVLSAPEVRVPTIAGAVAAAKAATRAAQM